MESTPPNATEVRLARLLRELTNVVSALSDRVLKLEQTFWVGTSGDGDGHPSSDGGRQ